VDTITGGNAPAYQIVTPTGWTAFGTMRQRVDRLDQPGQFLLLSRHRNRVFVAQRLFQLFLRWQLQSRRQPDPDDHLNSNTTYTLSVQVGNRTNGVWGGYHILLETTNGTVVGDWVGVYTSVAAPGTFATTARATPPGQIPRDWASRW
jgi:hypothetical protein